MPSGRKRGEHSGPRTERPRNRSARGAAVAVAIAGGLLAFVLFRGGASTARLAPIAKQNVLLITIDTLRADALGSYGGRAATPALDRLAADGVRFDFAHAHSVLTLPSHTSILTGTYPFQHGIRDNSGYRLAPGARTAATLLKQAGYATAAFVGAFPLHARFGLNQGFDTYDDRVGETRAPTEFVMPERPATEVVALARDWIAKAGRDGTAGGAGQAGQVGTVAQPWFVWVHVFDPHAPYRPPPPFDTQYPCAYDGEVAATDAALAPLIDDVRAGTRPTIVVVTGDHGEALGDHGEQTHGLFAYESTLRIPLIVAEIGVPLKPDTTWGSFLSYVGSAFRRTTRGEVSTVSARHVDILPTLLDAVGQPIPADLPGRTLLPADERRGGAPRPSYFEAMSAMLNRGWAPLTGVLVDREKYVDVPIPERYDLAADAAESSNLAGREPERDRALAASLRSFNAALPGRRKSEDADATARLRSLGYVTGDAPIKARYTEADDPKTLIAIDQEFHRAVELYVARRYGDATDAYRGIITRRPDMAIAYRHLAFVEWETGRPREAIATLRRAVDAGVTQGGMIPQLGTYLAESGDARGAIQLLEPLASAETPDPDMLNGLGIAYARAGRAADARRVFERMLGQDAANAMALTNLGALDLERGDLASARRWFEQAARVDPTSSQAHAGLGVVSSKLGERDAAVVAWKKAVELDRTNYDALYNLGTALAESGQMAAARPYLEEFVRTAPPAFYARDIRDVQGWLRR